MKRKKNALIGSQEQPMHEGFHSFHTQQQQMAASLPLFPNDAEVLTLKVAKAIKPTDSVGTLVDNLLGNRDVEANEDAKVLIRSLSAIRFNAIVFPSDTPDHTVIVEADAPLVATITRDDLTSETSGHTVGIEADFAANNLALLIDGLMAMAKPQRSLASLLNAIADKAKADAISLAGYKFVHDTTGNGALKVYQGAVGTLAGKIADVEQTDAEAAAVKATRW